MMDPNDKSPLLLKGLSRRDSNQAVPSANTYRRASQYDPINLLSCMKLKIEPSALHCGLCGSMTRVDPIPVTYRQ